ncbi:MAG: DUF4258 domain-containing protein [Thermodesulfovibrionia bacterium]|nr:DUF4258 domain-containing protein [Thermodesulfovibrionia bacterium]
MKIKDADIQHHLEARMLQRGISKEEIEITINKGWSAEDAKEGTIGKTFVFPYNNYWEGKYYKETEVTVYYKMKEDKIILLTAKARYGKNFKKGGN